MATLRASGFRSGSDVCLDVDLFSASIISPAYVLRMERFDDIVRFFENRGYEFKTFDEHSTKSKCVLPTNLNQNVVSKIRQLYKQDFELYSYSLDPHKVSSPPKAFSQTQIIDPVIKSLNINKKLDYANTNNFSSNLIKMIKDKNPNSAEKISISIARSFISERILQ